MKIKLLASIALAAMVGATVQADIAFTVDSGASQFAYVNAFNVSDDGFATGFGYDPNLSPSAFVGDTQVLGANTDIYTANGGGTGAENLFWFTGDGSGTQLKYVEVATYQEVTGTIGETVTFDFSVTANSLLSSGYTGVGFIKVLDGFASWATTQIQTVDLATLGSKSLSFTVADAGAGSEIVQAGFAITGLYVDPATAAGLGTVEVIPEPATAGLMAIFGGAIFMLRRYSSRTRLV